MKNMMMTVTMVVGMAAAALAQDSLSGGFDKSVGTKMAGAHIDARVEATGLSGLASGEAHLSAGVNLFGAYLEALGGDMTSSPKNGAATKLRLCGFTVFSKSVPQTWNWKISKTQDFLNVSQTLWVSFVPVKLNGRIGGGFSSDTTLEVAFNGARVHGMARAWAFGRASAGVDLVFVSCELLAKLKLFDTTLNFDLMATVNNGISAHADVTVEPIAIRIGVELKYITFAGWQTLEHTFLNYKAAARQLTLVDAELCW